MVYVPGITTRLYPRKGGGGGGKTGGGGGGSSGGGKTGSSGGGGSSSFGGGRSVPLSGSTVGGRTASTFGNGGGRPSTISSGPFAGRQQGGGTRDQVYGSQAYGSGYPGRGVGAGAGALGVAGLGFPFLFWPVVWGGGFGYGAGYLHTHEYGDADNSSRPGGPMTQTAFADKGSNNTFHLLADNTTVATLIDIVAANCTLGNTTMLVPMSFNTSDPSQPRPEQAVQYYRASSIVLTLDGYNDTSALVNDSSLPPTPLPAWVNHTFLDCLNQTIGNAAPLVDGAGSLMAVSPSLGLLGMIWLSVFAFLAA